MSARSDPKGPCKTWERRYVQLLAQLERDFFGRQLAGGAGAGAGAGAGGAAGAAAAGDVSAAAAAGWSSSWSPSLRAGHGPRSRALVSSEDAASGCQRLQPADADYCQAMESYCGARGQLAGVLATMVGALAFVAMLLAVIVGGEIMGPQARLRVRPEVLVLSLIHI